MCYSLKGPEVYVVREDTVRAIENERLIVIVRGVSREKLIPLARAMYAGGVRLLEVTYSADGRISDYETAENIKMLSEHFGDDMLIGAGTVLTERQAELTAKAGGRFVISPDTYAPVIKRTKELGIVSIPGALTPSEIREAERAGADFVKLFPVENLGTAYVKAIKAPLSKTRMLAVGGIDENNMEDYLKVGISGFGVGSNIVKREYVEGEEYEKLTLLARKYTAVIDKWKNS